MAKFNPDAARKKRLARIETRVEWFAKRVESGVNIGMEQRVRMAGRLMRDKVVANLSKPVVKRKSSRTGRIVVDPSSRSKPGEFPRADTTRLMKDIFVMIQKDFSATTAFIGTTLDYGLLHETQTGRSFLVRTLRESRQMLQRILVKSGSQGIAIFSQAPDRVG